MTWWKWLFMSKYKKLLHHIEIAKANRQRLHLPNGVVLDFDSAFVIVDVEKLKKLKRKMTLFTMAKGEGGEVFDFEDFYIVDACLASEISRQEVE